MHVLPRQLRVEVKRDWVPYLNSGTSNDRSDTRKDALKDYSTRSVSLEASCFALRKTYLEVIDSDFIVHISNHQSSVVGRIGAGTLQNPALRTIVSTAVHIVGPGVVRRSRRRPL